MALSMLTILMPRAGLAQERCEPAAGRVVSAQGTVELQRQGTAVWAVVTLEELLCLGDTVRVGRASRAALALANDSILRLDQRTTLRLQGVVEERRSLLDLLLGSVYFFSHQPRALAVDTPFVNAAAEGTEFLVRLAEDRAEVVMLDGQVLLENPYGELRVAKGDAAVAPEGQAPAPMIVARPRDAVAWALYYPPILAPLAEREARPRGLPPGLQAALDAVALNDYPGALAALDAVPEAARDARYWTYRAGVLLNVGQVDEAQAAIARALALDPDAGEALAQRAIIAIVQNRPDEALADARRAAELSPDSGAAAVALSYALQASFQLEQARDVLREATKRTPENALVFARLSEIEQSLGDLRAAQRAAERAVALAPGLARTQTVLGFAALTRIDISAAEAAFERAIALDSAEPLARLGLGLAIIRSGDLEAGAREIEIAAGLDPNDSLVRSYLGKAYFEERRDEQAGAQYAIAKELDPNDPTPWFYDAIRLQLDNRPVEALRSLERSIELNDNRAVYRSRLLLEEDQATRGTSLARIYDDLGFRQLGINEASKSLTLDPSNSSAHRFLSDVYLGGRGFAISRVSELLQAQMLQDININPVQPSLAEANISLVARSGPASAAFNEFTPLFERQDTQINAAGVAGNDDTYGGEGVVSMLYDRYSLSAGAFHFETDGWRRNYHVNDNIYNVFGQAAITPELNAQVEFRRRELDRGDLQFNFNPDDLLKNFRDDLDQNIARAGLRYSPAPQSDFLLSFIYSDLKEKDSNNGIDDGVVFSDQFRVNEKSYQIEGQHIYQIKLFNITTGAAFYDVDSSEDFLTIEDGERFPDSNNFNITHPRGYVYGNVRFPDPVLWTIGASYDDYKDDGFGEDLKVDQVNPKFGVQWDITNDVRLRAAVFRTLKPALVNSRTLEPTQVAGFNQFFDDFNATKAWRYGLGIDWRLTDSLFAGAEFTWRDVSEHFSDRQADNKFESRDEQLHRGYVYWMPLPQVALSAELIYDDYDPKSGFLTEFAGVVEKVETLSVPLGVRYFHPSGLFAGAGATYVDQEVHRVESDDNDDFVVVDAVVGYRFPKRFGIASLEVNNLFDTGFHYQDDSFRNVRDEPSISRYIPKRTIMGRVTINF
jgi:tetratricopeptide (TPR) repeat protein